MAPADRVARPADCKLLDWLPHFLRRERSNGRVAMQMQLDWQKNLPLLQMVVGVRENLRSRPGGCVQATKWASKCISLLSVGVSSWPCGCFVACRSISSVWRTSWWPSWLSLVVRSGGSRHQELHWRMRRWASWWLSLWLHLVVLSGHALPPGIGPGNAQMGQLVAGTAAAGGWQIADGRRHWA